MKRDDEWIRLPGLFLWSEVCELFDAESKDWRFVAKAHSASAGEEPLYVVLMASPRDGERRARSPNRPSPGGEHRR